MMYVIAPTEIKEASLKNKNLPGQCSSHPSSLNGSNGTSQVIVKEIL